jgi:hypothetical protein
MRGFWKFVLMCLVLAMPRAFADDAKWLTPPPSETWLEAAVALDARYVLPLSDDAQTVAQEMLGFGGSFMLMDSSAFEMLCPGKTVPAGLTPFLVRAVVLAEPRGREEVLQNGDEILMQYAGPKVVAKERKRAYILFLPRSPKKLYVTISLHG